MAASTTVGPLTGWPAATTSSSASGHGCGCTRAGFQLDPPPTAAPTPRLPSATRLPGFGVVLDLLQRGKVILGDLNDALTRHLALLDRLRVLRCMSALTRSSSLRRSSRSISEISSRVAAYVRALSVSSSCSNSLTSISAIASRLARCFSAASMSYLFSRRFISLRSRRCGREQVPAPAEAPRFAGSSARNRRHRGFVHRHGLREGQPAPRATEAGGRRADSPEVSGCPSSLRAPWVWSAFADTIAAT